MGIPPARMGGIPHGHRIEAAGPWSDGFEESFRVRGEAPLRLIETAMGKVMARDLVEPEPTGDVSGDEEGEAA